MTEGSTYEATDDELGALLHKLLIVEGNEEVEVQHPTEGLMVVTKDSYHTMIESLEKARNMSPAERLEETARLKRKKQMKFRTAMIDAKVYTVDVEDDDNFGKDIEGNEIDMLGMTFVAVMDYPKGTGSQDLELGAFVDESMQRPPVRILTKPEE